MKVDAGKSETTLLAEPSNLTPLRSFALSFTPDLDPFTDSLYIELERSSPALSLAVMMGILFPFIELSSLRSGVSPSKKPDPLLALL